MTDFRDLLASLLAEGLWTSLLEADQAALRQALGDGEDVTWSGGGAWRADGEDLADGDVEGWLAGMAASLRERDVDLRVATLRSPHDPNSSGYSVELNGVELKLYDFNPALPGLPASVDPWLDCTVKPLAVVNRLLADRGSPARLGVFWPGGNDGLALLADEATLRRAAASSDVSDFQIP